jgi:hypothetical protein
MISPCRYCSLPLQFVLLALLLDLALSQSCDSLRQTSCAQCTQAGCSWCPISGLCIPVTQTVRQGCRFRMNSPSSCPSSYCSSRPSYGACGMCTSDYFCYWCASSGSCGSWGQCSTHRVITYPHDCWAAAPPPSPSPPAHRPLPPPPSPPSPAPAPPANSQLPAYSPCVSGHPPSSCSPEQRSLQAVPGMCPTAPPNGPSYFAPFGIDSLSKCAILPSRSVFAGDMSCTRTPVPSSCSAASRHWAGLGAMASCSSQWAQASGCGMCSAAVPVWAPYGRDSNGCPIIWCPQGCPFVWTLPSSPPPSPSPPSLATPNPPSAPAPASPSSCAGGLFATASSAGSTMCSPCPPGSYCPPGSNAPSPCPAGTASNFSGASSSTVCNHFTLCFYIVCDNPGRSVRRALPHHSAPKAACPVSRARCCTASLIGHNRLQLSTAAVLAQHPASPHLTLALSLLCRLVPSRMHLAPALPPTAPCAPQAITAPLYAPPPVSLSFKP